jgi:hypothetical protein
VQLFSRFDGAASEAVAWRPDEAPFGALAAPALRFAPCGEMRAVPGDR